MNPAESDNSLVISYLTLRKAVGILGMLLPFVVALGAWLIFQTGLQNSISAYYYTAMRDVFVGTLCAIGLFLFSYKGYERQDGIAGNLACVFAVGVALFPTSPECESCNASQIAYRMHGVFAALFFLTLAYFSLVLFTKTDPSKTPTPRKLQRNAVYRICGYTMLACILLIGAISLLPDSITGGIKKSDPIFWLEAIAIVAFGVSWFTKGEAILKDQPEETVYPAPSY